MYNDTLLTCRLKVENTNTPLHRGHVLDWIDIQHVYWDKIQNVFFDTRLTCWWQVHECLRVWVVAHAGVHVYIYIFQGTYVFVYLRALVCLPRPVARIKCEAGVYVCIYIFKGTYVFVYLRARIWVITHHALADSCLVVQLHVFVLFLSLVFKHTVLSTLQHTATYYNTLQSSVL